MAFTEIPKVLPDGETRSGTFYFSTVATGPQDGIYLSPYTKTLTITALGDSVATTDIEATTSTVASINDGTAVWVPLSGLTGVTTVAKQQGTPYTFTAIRPNVKSANAGTIRLDVLATA